MHGATLADPAHERATVLKNLKATDNNNEDDQYNEDQKNLENNTAQQETNCKSVTSDVRN